MSFSNCYCFHLPSPLSFFRSYNCRYFSSFVDVVIPSTLSSVRWGIRYILVVVVCSMLLLFARGRFKRPSSLSIFCPLFCSSVGVVVIAILFSFILCRYHRPSFSSFSSFSSLTFDFVEYVRPFSLTYIRCRCRSIVIAFCPSSVVLFFPSKMVLYICINWWLTNALSLSFPLVVLQLSIQFFRRHRCRFFVVSVILSSTL